MEESERLLVLQVKELSRKVEQQEKLIEKYRILAKVVQEAEIWDYSIYDEVPDDTWVALDQTGYERMKQVLSELDELQPWKTSIEKRLGGG
ncbi:hypothetical protein D4T97_001475 [Siminovitchia acidinfaciens]|uniref:DUF4298 domain-containing protein n=1 Tax=Siminovitchia acidinfaciens TaxID=2321395 RepID=A0A429Y716_9BACI|nr:hypothetical protein [Siminovitchia acidinfaciens]RST77195.1 hypothetical protein D4T97_001475 [Siminovitchia acidinfaciens]